MTDGPKDGAPMPSPVEAELWSFAIAFYGGDGVSDACLVLQDRLGVDVPLLIFAVFAALRHGLTLGTDQLVAADASVRAWRAEVVEPLRRLRRRLKIGPGPGPSSMTERLRGRVKEIELEAERLELAALACGLDGIAPRAAALDGAEAIPERVARHFARGEAFDVGEVAAALMILARAVRRASDENAAST